MHKKLYACNCDQQQDIHLTIDQCELRNLKKEDGREFLYPGQIKEAKLDDIHDWHGGCPCRLN